MTGYKYSRQRECIKACLQARHDHPTAEDIYRDVREQLPSISLGTIYRNLAQLTENGEIRKITVGDGVDHYDDRTDQHYHFVCRSCHKVLDLKMSFDMAIDESAAEELGALVEGHMTFFYGLCGNCNSKEELA